MNEMNRNQGRNRVIAAVVVLILAVAAITITRSHKGGAGGGAAAGGGASATGGKPAAPPIPVSVMVAKIGAMGKSVPVVGQLQSDEHITLTSKIAGKVVQIFVNTGDRVKAGDVVAQLDTSDALSQLASARAMLEAARVRYQQAKSGVGLKDTQTAQAIAVAKTNLASAKTHLSQMITTAKIEDTQADVGVQQARSNLAAARQNQQQVVTGARTQERAQATLAVAKAQADYNQAADNFRRMDALFKQGAVAQQQRDDANYQLQVAQTGLDTAKQAASLVEAGSRSEQVANAEQTVRQSEAALQLAQAQVARRALSRQDVLAAQDQVRQMQAQLEVAQAGTAQYAMTRQDVEAAAAAVTQAQTQVDLAQLQLQNSRIVSPVSGVVDTRPATVGSSVTPTTAIITVAPSRGLYFEAQVPEDAIASVHVGDPVQTTVDALPGRTFPGRISEIIPVADAATRVYRVHISIPDSAGALPQNGFARGKILVSQVSGIIVPADTLQSDVGDWYLFVVSGGVAHRRNVTIGLQDETQAQITSGLNVGEEYITVGQLGVTDGARVTVKPDPRAGATPLA